MLRARLAVAVLATTVNLANPSQAIASTTPAPLCPPTVTTCTITVERPGVPEKPGPDETSEPDSGEGRVCNTQISNSVVPCHSENFGWFNGSDGCYYRLLDPQPPENDLLWEGNYPNGAMYGVTCMDSVPGTNGGWRWLPTPPPGFGPPQVTPAELAARAVDQMQLAGPAIGITVPPDRLGLVGVPVWLVRVRQRAWELPTAPDRSVGTLRHLATIAVAIHAHAAVFHASPQGPAAPLVTQGRRWQALSSKLAPMMSLMPHDPGIHAELVALAHLLPAIAPLSKPGGASSADPYARRVGAALGASVALTSELAQHGARTFTVLARTHDLFVPARTLTGDEITDDPDLVSARLHGAVAPASRRQVDDLTHLFEDTATQPMPKPYMASTPMSAAAQRSIERDSVRLERSQ